MQPDTQRNITAKKVADVLIEIFARHGIPGEILTDQGTNFTSSLLGELYKLIGVTALRTSPYHPQTDGLVERFNIKRNAAKGTERREEGLGYHGTIYSICLLGGTTSNTGIQPIWFAIWMRHQRTTGRSTGGMDTKPGG